MSYNRIWHPVPGLYVALILRVINKTIRLSKYRHQLFRENYHRQYNHLSGVPSATEMDKQEKEINSLKEENASLKSRLASK